MEYINENNTRELVALLQDFLSTIIEEYKVCEDIIQVLSSPVNKEYIEKIKSGLEVGYLSEIEERFLQTIDSTLSGKLTDFSEFDSVIEDLCGEIEKLTYKSGSNICEGVYQSPLEDLTIGTVWTSNGTSLIGTPSISVHMRPHKNQKKESESETEHISCHIEKVSDSKTVVRFDEDRQVGYKLYSDCRNQEAKPMKENSFTMEDIELPVTTIDCFMAAGVYDIDILTTTTFEKLKRIRNLGLKHVIDFLYKFDKAGYRIKDCSIKDYPTIDDFVKDKFNCLECSSSLNGTSDNLKRRLCMDCASRLDRLVNATTITLEVKKPEFQIYTGDEQGFTIHININSQTDKPIKLKLEECSIYTDGRQRISNYNYAGYAFSEEYAFPNTTKTFAKIWITDKWNVKELSAGEDYITISFKDTNSNKTFFFKFLFVNNFSDWRFYDYYELD